MNVSEAGLLFITSFEGVVLRLYNDPAGHCTIGVGHLVHLGPCDGRATEAPFRNGLSEQQAIDLLRSDVRGYADAVERFTFPALNQNQFDAMVSLCYNIGTGGYNRSLVLREINDGRWSNVCAELRKIIYGVGSSAPLAGLIRRREAECRLFHKAVLLHIEEDGQMPVPWVRDTRTFKSYYIVGGRKRHVRDAAQEAALLKAGYIKRPEITMTTTELAAIEDAD